MNIPSFPTQYTDILSLIDQLDVVRYAQSRNYVDGAVSRLSPYISRGVISLPLVMERVRSRYTADQAYTFIFELAWREYFQRQWWQLGEQIWTDIRQPQSGVIHHGVPQGILTAHTGISAIDTAIQELYDTGYMHNHLRMYTASLTCHISHSHWLAASRWMYYHLLDHDIASNTLSWQWVAGTFSSKKYYCTQENINKYCHTDQRGTYLDHSYEALPDMPVPDVLKPFAQPALDMTLPDTPLPTFDHSKPLLIYHAYHLDPTWRSDMDANRLLLIERSHYAQHPVSPMVMSFIWSLSKNIPDIKVYVGEWADIATAGDFPAIYSRSHPAFQQYPGHKDEPEWMFPKVTKIGSSFMSFWKECEKSMKSGQSS